MHLYGRLGQTNSMNPRDSDQQAFLNVPVLDKCLYSWPNILYQVRLCPPQQNPSSLAEPPCVAHKPQHSDPQVKMVPKPQGVPARLSRLIARVVWTACDLFLIEVPKPYFASLEPLHHIAKQQPFRMVGSKSLPCGCKECGDQEKVRDSPHGHV
jgi:hypothetical protein